MDIRFDSNKDRINIAKQGVSLALAAELEWDLLVCREDDRAAYGELRLQCFAPIGRKIYCVICIEEEDCYRIISLREATNREKRTYSDHL
ncbi:MAG: BrnT family toxin [Chromatiaceae bacterium]|nr:BrnT family toxin [Chromatiaceae bacterium]